MYVGVITRYYKYSSNLKYLAIGQNCFSAVGLDLLLYTCAPDMFHHGMCVRDLSVSLSTCPPALAIWL